MTRSFRRIAVVAAFLLLGGLAACSTDNDIAARVGSETITVAQLDAAVARGYADPDIGEAAKEAGAAFRRNVLTLMIQDKVYAAAAKEYGVDFTDEDVLAMQKEILGGQDPREAIKAVIEAGQPILYTPEDISTISTAQLVNKLIGEQTVDTSEAALRKLYEEQKETTYELGLISVADQQTAQTILDQLQADPAAYAQVAQQYASDPNNPGAQQTLVEPQSVKKSELNQIFADAVGSLAAGRSTILDLTPQGGFWSVVQVSKVTTPTFEEMAEQLKAQLNEQVLPGGQAKVAEVGKKLDVWINPRFGSLETDPQGLPSVKGGSGTGTFKILTPDSPDSADSATQPPTQ